MKKNIIVNLAFFFWIALIFVLLLLPQGLFSSSSQKIISIPHLDKLVHCSLFGGFCFLTFFFVKQRLSFEDKKIMLISFLLTFVFGFFTEVLQALTHQWCERNFALSDLFADSVGAILALGVITLGKKKIKL